jgi:DNA polymerase III delta prime subunit
MNMNLSKSIGNLSHHAYALVDRGSTRSDVISFLEGDPPAGGGVNVRGNPDVFVQKYEVLTIDDARALKELHATRPFSSREDKGGKGGRKFFILEIDSITHEAQNALLKIFEEPNEYAHFFLIIPSEELLLPTLRSRLFIVRGATGDKGNVKVDKNIADFLSSGYAGRIAFVDKLAVEISDGKKPKTAALEFCADLSRHLRQEGIEKNAAALAAIAQTESYLRDRAPSIKQLLEYVALSV